jgi:hypothetical protein
VGVKGRPVNVATRLVYAELFAVPHERAVTFADSMACPVVRLKNGRTGFDAVIPQPLRVSETYPFSVPE